MIKRKSFEDVGIAWYTEDEWKKMKEMASDSGMLETTYPQWKKTAEDSLVEMKNAGLIGKKVYIKADDYFEWCRLNSLPLDASSRSRYILEMESEDKNV